MLQDVLPSFPPEPLLHKSVLCLHISESQHEIKKIRPLGSVYFQAILKNGQNVFLPALGDPRESFLPPSFDGLFRFLPVCFSDFSEGIWRQGNEPGIIFWRVDDIDDDFGKQDGESPNISGIFKHGIKKIKLGRAGQRSSIGGQERGIRIKELAQPKIRNLFLEKISKNFKFFGHTVPSSSVTFLPCVPSI